MDNKDVIITGALDSSALEKSISDLVKTVEQKTSQMAKSFDDAMQKMGNSMQGVATSNNAIINGINAQIAANKKLADSIDKITEANKNAKKESKKVSSKEDIFGMPINTEKAIETKIKSLKELKKVTKIDTSDYAEIKKELESLQQYKKRIFESEEARIKRIDEQKDEAAKKDRERRREEAQERSLALKEEKLRLQEENIAQRKITAEQRKREKGANEQIKNAIGMPEESVDQMIQKVEKLKQLQQNLSDQGLLSITKINQTARAIDKLNKKIRESNTPEAQKYAKEDIFAMPETTLAEISSKMKAISKVRENAVIGGHDLNVLNNEYNRLHVAQKKALSSGIQLEKQNNKLMKTFKNLSERVVFYFTLGALTGFVDQLIKIRAEYEMIERSIGVLIDDMDKGSQVFRTLQDKAKESPFTLIELGTATKQLAAYDFQTKDLVDTTSRLADISSALNVPIERLVYNLGQIKAQNVLNARDARDFANAGFAIVPMLAKMYSEQEKQMVTAADVYDRMKKKMVSYKDVMNVINQVTDEGGKFFEFQAKQAETLKVKIANLSLAFNDMLNDMGKESSWIFDFMIDSTKKLFENWKKIFKIITSILGVVGTYKVTQIINNKLIERQKSLLGESNDKISKWSALWDIVSKKISNVALSLKNFLLSPATILSAIAIVAGHLIANVYAAKQKIQDLIDGTREKAIESIKSVSDFIEANKEDINNIGTNKLSISDAEKLWEGYKEQLKAVSDEGEILIATLEKIEDVNKRMKESKKILNDIITANETLRDNAESLSYYTGDVFGLGGMVDEYKILKRTIKEYNELLEKKSKGILDNWRFGVRKNKLESEFKTAKRKTEEFSQSIVNIIKKRGDKSLYTINEILTKSKNIFLKNNEEIRGDAADMFNIIVDEQVKSMLNRDKEWSNIITNNNSLEDKFIDRLKKQKNIFAALTRNQLDNAKSYEKLPQKAKEAFEKILNEFIAEMPLFEQQIKDMVNNINAWNGLKIKMGFEFNIKSSSEMQKIFDEHIKPMETAYMLRPKDGVELSDYLDSLKSQAEITKKRIEKYQKSVDAGNKEHEDNLKKEKEYYEDLKEAASVYGNDIEKDSEKKKRQRKEETLLARAIKNEIQLISDLNSSYNKLNKAGEKRSTIIGTLSNLYSKQVENINKILGAHGIPQFNIKDFAGEDANAQLAYFEKLRSVMVEKGLDKKEMEAFKRLGKELMGVTVDANVDNITNKVKEMGKALEEVSKRVGFAKELNNDEEMRAFFNIIGVDIDNLPQTADEAVKEIQDAINAAGVKNFDVLKTDINKFAKENDFDENSEWFKILKKAIGQARKLYKDEFVERINNLKDYIEKYGTAQEKIYQITKHYNHLIESTKDENRKKYLKEEMNNKISQEKMREISRGIDWNVAMPEIGGIIRKVAKKVLDDVNTYMNSAEFRALPSSDKKSWYDLRNQLNKTTGGNSTSPFNFGIWGKIADQMKDWEKAVQELKKSQENLENALDKLAKAEKNGYDTKQESENVKTASDKVKEAENKVNQSQQDLTKSSEEATNGIQGFANAVNELTNGSIYGLINGFSKLTTIIIDGTAKSLSELGGEIGGIVGAILQILDALGSKSRDTINQMMDSVIHTLEGVIRDLPMIFVDIIVKDIPRIIGAAFDGVGDWFGADLQGTFNNSNAKKVNELTEKLTKSNERLQKSIDYLSEIMGESAGAKAIYASEKAIEAQLEIDKNTREKWIAQMNYHGSHHSNAYYFNDEYFAQWEEEIKNALKAAGLNGKNIKSWADVQTLSAEEIAAIRAFAPTAFKYLEEVGEYDKSQYLNEFADLAGEIEKLENKIKENLTQTSFDGMRDSFLSALVDMEKDSKEFSNDFKKIVFKSMVNAFVLNDEFDKWLKKFQEDWANKIREGSMSKADWTKFNEDYVKKYEELMGLTQGLANGIGYKGDKELDLSSLQQGIQSITEETGGAIEAYLNGISAQVYLHNDKLQELINMTQVNTGSNSEMIQIMKNNLESVNVIKNAILDCLSPSRALRVELTN